MLLTLAQPWMTVDDFGDRCLAEHFDGLEGAVVELMGCEQRARVRAVGLAEQQLGRVEPSVECRQVRPVGGCPHPQRAPCVHQQSQARHGALRVREPSAAR